MSRIRSKVARLPELPQHGDDVLDAGITGKDGQIAISRHREESTDDLYIINWNKRPYYTAKRDIPRYEMCENVSGAHCVFADGKYAIVSKKGERGQSTAVIINTGSLDVVATLNGETRHAPTYLILRDRLVCLDLATGTIHVMTGPEWKAEHYLTHDGLRHHARGGDQLVTYGGGMAKFWDTKEWKATSVCSTTFNFLDDDRMNGGIVQLKTLDGQIWHLHLDGTRVSPNLVRLVRQHLERPHILWVAGLSKHLFYDRQEEVVKIFNETNQHNESYELQFSPPVASVSPLGPNGFLAVADSHISICLQFGPFIKIDRACNGVDVRVQLFKNSCIIFYYHQENVGYQAVQLIELVEEDSNGPDSSVDDSEIAETLECLKAYTDMTSLIHGHPPTIKTRIRWTSPLVVPLQIPTL